MRTVVIFCSLFISVMILSAQPISADSTQTVADTIWVIPAGPIAGAFTSAARVTINDTIAGWAHIMVEGWVPVSAVADRMSAADPSINAAPTGEDSKSGVRVQCAAITTKGTRCKRMAESGSKYCWQHQASR